jgi:hypothetical protein
MEGWIGEPVCGRLLGDEGLGGQFYRFAFWPEHISFADSSIDFPRLFNENGASLMLSDWLEGQDFALKQRATELTGQSLSIEQ